MQSIAGDHNLGNNILDKIDVYFAKYIITTICGAFFSRSRKVLLLSEV
jgi:hypothetical protein